MFSDHLGLHLIGIDIKMFCQVNTETQAVEEGACTEHAIVPRAGAGNISERIRRIGYHQYHRVRRRTYDSGNHIAINLGVGLEKPIGLWDRCDR